MITRIGAQSVLAVLVAIGIQSGTRPRTPIAVQRIPRTPQGRPNFEGMWLNNTATPLERLKGFEEQPFFTEAQAEAFERDYLVVGLSRAVASRPTADFEPLAAASDIDTYEPGHVLPDRRTSLIVDPPDGKVPALTADGRRRAAERSERVDKSYGAGPENLGFGDRCLFVGNTALPPLQPIFYNNHLRIVQTAGVVALVSEMIHEARIVAISNRLHLPAHVTQWKGDPVGRWQGDTLVIDSTNFTDQTSFRGSGAQLHLIERLTLTDPNTITYEFTVDDPASFTERWTAKSVWLRTNSEMYEYACHEANYSIVNILRGARASEHSPQ